MRKLLLLALVHMIGQQLQSQDINYYGIFPTIDHSAQFSKRWSYNVYIFDAIKPYESTRNHIQDEARSFYFYQEAGLSYALTDRLTATAAYVHERQNPFKSYYREENRAFQQLTLKLPIGRTELKQRLRFDERFIQSRFLEDVYYTHRLRYLLGWKYPFRSEKMYFFAYSEFFFSTPDFDFDYNENWSAAQLGFKINSWSAIEAGPLYVGWVYSSHNWLNQFYLQVTWATHFDWRNQKVPVSAP